MTKSVSINNKPIVEIDSTTPVDVSIEGTLPVNVQNTPTVNVSGSVQTEFTNTNIQSYSYVHNGNGFIFEAADINGKTINLNHTYYTSTEITALGSSTDINLWLSAFNDSMLQQKFVETYNDEHEETVYYQHPSLGNGTKCLKLIFQYSTENSQKVVKSIFANVSDWSFTDDIQGSVSISAGTITSPNPSGTIAMHTVVTTLTITDNTLGGITLSLSGINASLYHLHEVETGVHSQTTLTYVATRTYQIHAHSGFPTGSSYSHSITVTATGDIFGVSDSVNIETSSTFVAPATYTNLKYLKASSTTATVTDFALNGTNKNPFADNNSMPTLATPWSIAFWLQVPSAASSFDAIMSFAATDTRQHFKLYHLNGKLAASFTDHGSAADYGFTFTDYNTWKHVVIVKEALIPRDPNYSSNDSKYFLQIYIDGVPQNPPRTYFDNNPIFTSNDWENTNVSIFYLSGFAYSYTQNTTSASGKSGRQWKIDELVTFSKALSSDEVDDVYNNGVAQDYTELAASYNVEKYFRFGDHASDVNTGSLRFYDEVNDTVYFEEDGNTNGGVEDYDINQAPYNPGANGNTKYVETENSSYLKETVNITMQNSWSISWWYKADSFNGTGDTAHYFGIARAGSDYSYSNINYRQHGVHVQLRGSNTAYLDFNAPGNSGNGTYMALSSAASSIANGTWRHCALVWTAHSPALNGVISMSNQSNLKFYVDGTEISLANSNGGTPTMTDTYALNELRMGRWLSGTTETSFKMDEVALFDYALTSGSGGDIEKIYNNGIPTDLANTTGLTAPTRFFRFEDTNDLAKDTINDSTSTAFTNATSKTY